MVKFFVKRTRRGPQSAMDRAAYMAGMRHRRGAAMAKRRGANMATRGLQLSKGEFKAIDTNVSFDVNTTGTVTLLNGCARGDEISERTGRETLIKSIEMKWVATSTDTTGTAQVGRLLVVYDKQPNAAALTIANVLSVTGSGLVVMSPRLYRDWETDRKSVV